MSTSWIIRRKGQVAGFVETWNPRVVARLNTAKYEAVPVLAYLYELNRAIRDGQVADGVPVKG